MKVAERNSGLGWRALLVALAVGLVPYALLVWKFNFLCDDAFISFRYSRNFAEGLGLRYNLGTGQPVEGYSNFLWVIWCALFERLGMDVTLWARLSSIACGVGLVVLVTRFAERNFRLGLAGTTATAVFLGTLPPFVVWSTGGLATVPMALTCFATFERLLGHPERPRGIQAGLLALLTCLIRADGLLWVGLILLCAGVSWLLSRRQELLRSTLIAGGILAAGLAVMIAWRYSYYGDFVPNTARVKAGFSDLRIERGYRYLVSFFLTMPACAVVIGAGLLAWKSRRERAVAVALVLVAANLAYAIYVGGDFMAMGRFLVPMVPFLVVLFAAGWSALYGASRGRIILASGFAGICILLGLLPSFNRYVFPRSLRENFHFRWNRARYVNEFEMWMSMRLAAKLWASHGRILKAVTQPGESIVLEAMGAVGYYSGLTVYDTYGLTNREVAERGAPPRSDTSPGHDLRVQRSFFFPWEPTYLGYMIMRKGTSASVDSIPPQAAWARQHADRLTIEVRPMPEGESPAWGEIWLMRLGG